MRPEREFEAGEIAAEPARDVRAGHKYPPGPSEPPGVSLSPRRDRLGNVAAAIVAKLCEASVAPCFIGLAAIAAARTDQIDARTDRVVVVNRPVVRDAALVQGISRWDPAAPVAPTYLLATIDPEERP